MGREIILLHFGQAGVQLGSALWELFCAEHRLTPDGTVNLSEDGALLGPFEHMDAFFYEGYKSWSPRALLIDLEPSVIDEIRTGCYRKLWRPSCLISGTEDASNNYGRGCCTIGRLKLDETLEAIRKLAESSKGMSAFEIVHSHSGGTGSGMSSLVLENLYDDYGKTFKFTTSVFPSPTYSQSTVDPYNSVLHTNSTIDTIDCAILFDNQTMFNRCSRELYITQPSYTDINRLLAQMLSSVFLAHRFNFGGSQQAGTMELLTNLVPYPRIHFHSLSFAPLQPRCTGEHDSLNIAELTRAVFSESAKTLDFPCTQNHYISCAMLYRGLCSPKPIYEALQSIKGSPKVGANFVDWCPTGFKIGLSPFPPTVLPTTPLVSTPRSVCMLAGNLGLRHAWRRNNAKFDVLFSRRSFVHWFVGEGIEESEFAEARENLAALEQDYEELTNETLMEMAVHGQEHHAVLPTPASVRQKSGKVSHSAESVSARSQLMTNPDLSEFQDSGLQSNNANRSRRRQLYADPQISHSRPSGDLGLTEWTIPTDLSDASGVREDQPRHPHYRRHHQEKLNRFAYPNPAADLSLDTTCVEKRPVESSQRQRAFRRPYGDIHSSEGLRSTEIVSSVTEVRTTEMSRPTIPRGRNMNNPRHSQLNTDTGFLPTVPLIRTDDACTERATPFHSMVTSTVFPTPESPKPTLVVPNLPTGPKPSCRHGLRHRSRRQPSCRQDSWTKRCPVAVEVDQERPDPSDRLSPARPSGETESSTSGFVSMNSSVCAVEDVELLTDVEDVQGHAANVLVEQVPADNPRGNRTPTRSKQHHTHVKHRCHDHQKRYNKSSIPSHLNPHMTSRVRL